jgi:hypothetical protein
MGKYKEGVNPLLLEALQPEGESDPTKVMQAYAKLLIYASRNICALGVDCINRAVLYYLPQVCEDDIHLYHNCFYYARTFALAVIYTMDSHLFSSV